MALKEEDVLNKGDEDTSSTNQSEQPEGSESAMETEESVEKKTSDVEEPAPNAAGEGDAGVMKTSAEAVPSSSEEPKTAEPLDSTKETTPAATADLASKNTRTRVKLYVLTESRVWDDKGTGHVTYVAGNAEDDSASALGSLIVRSESDGTILLESKIQIDTTYQKQQDTLVVWTEYTDYDLALSFQEKAGCTDVWEKICSLQGKDPQVESTGQSGFNDSDSDSGGAPDVSTESSTQNDSSLPLPPAEPGRLSEILSSINVCMASTTQREYLAVALESNGYIRKLLDVFRMCEDLDNFSSCCLLFQIFKAIFMLNRNSLYEILFSEDNLNDVIGVLEYDPTFEFKQNHRDYLWNKARYHEVLPLESAQLRAKIHQTFRVQYIQEIIFPANSVFEDNLLSTLNSFIFFNKVDIVQMIQQDDDYMKQVFGNLCDEQTDQKQRLDLVLFVKELCTFSQTLRSRDDFFRTLSSHGVIPALETSIAACVEREHPEQDMRIIAACIDVLAMMVEHNPPYIREFLMNQAHAVDDDSSILLNLIVEQVFNDTDPELACAMQVIGIVRLLIDPESMMSTSGTAKTEKTIFLSFFYKRCMPCICTPLLSNTTGGKICHDDYRTAHLISLVLEILTFCTEHHTFHIRNYVLNKDLLKRVLVLLQSKHMFLALAAVRFLRRIVQLKDEFYNRHIIKLDLLRPIVNAYLNNGHSYNILNSALIELFEYINDEDVRSLLNYFCTAFLPYFTDVVYVQTFEKIRRKYEQRCDQNSSPAFTRESMVSITSPSVFKNSSSTTPITDFHRPSLPSLGTRMRRDPRQLDEDEEAYFNEDNENDDDTPNELPETPSDIPERAFVEVVEKPLPLPLVKGEDDEDEFSTSPLYSPPPLRRTPSVAIHVRALSAPPASSGAKLKPLVDYDDDDDDDDEGGEGSSLAQLAGMVGSLEQKTGTTLKREGEKSEELQAAKRGRLESE